MRSNISLPEQLPFWEFSDDPFSHVMLHDGSVAGALLYWLSLSLFFWYTVVIVGIECGLHRLFTHKSYKVSKFWEYIISLLPIGVTAGSPIVWTAK